MARMMLPVELEGERLSPGELSQVDIFKDVNPKVLARFPGAVVRREVKPGDVICRQGEGGTTAFYVLEGTVRIHINRRTPQRAQRRGDGGIVGFFGRIFGGKRIEAHHQHQPDELVPIDASVDLTYGQLATTLGAGEIFGEMSCLNLAPRSATVVAQTPCVMLEFLRHIYEALQKSGSFKVRMDENYRRRALHNHFRNVPLFRDLPDEAIRSLETHAQLIQVRAGADIFHEGDRADGMYIIRLGQVRVSRRFPGGQLTLAYLTKGDFFGETAVLRNSLRNATCTAVDHPVFEGDRRRDPAMIELVKITTEDFHAVIEQFPKFRGKVEMVINERLYRGRHVAMTISAGAAPSRNVEDLGLLQGQNLMLIDLERCTRCDQCVDACVESHDDGLTRLFRDGPRFDKYLVPSTCRMCLDPVCMIGCPVGSIRRTEDLNIFIEDWCIGCEKCAKQCPYDAIVMHDVSNLGEVRGEELRRIAETGEVVEVDQQAVVCDQCSGLSTGPACVYACPHDAAIRVNAAEFLSAVGLFERSADRPASPAAAGSAA